MNKSKIPLVLLPGSLCDQTMWSAQIAALDDIASCQVVLWGHSASVITAAENTLASVPNKRFALAGFSLGGFVALEMVRHAPDRILGLALLDTSGRPDKPENKSRRLANIDAFLNGSREVIDCFADLTFGSSTSSLVKAAISSTMHSNAEALYVLQQTAMMARPDARVNLAKITCPTLVLCGAEDGATPPELHREIASAIRHASYTEIPGVGHMTTLEAPDAVNKAMRSWLADIHDWRA
jgi:pimeloyl-ACP methyl ester carboxylesterase